MPTNQIFQVMKEILTNLADTLWTLCDQTTQKVFDAAIFLVQVT